MNKSILIIDDDIKIINLLSEYLSANNYLCTAVDNPINGLIKLNNQHFDLIILDIMLPEMNGFEVCKKIRKEYDIPIIMLTSRADVTDKVVGLEMGADDYIAKPFELRELLARIASVLRRADGKLKNNPVLKFKNLIVDSNKRTAYYKNKDIDLSSTEFELLFLFAVNNGKVLSREEIMKNTRGISWESFDRSVDVMVSRLRNKFKPLVKQQTEFIKTVHSVGYMFYTEEA
jgi:DNA-binding response OmpR family regulator